MTSLRVLGLIVAASLTSGAFLYLRGERWSRVNFSLSVVVSGLLAAVSIEPNVVDSFRDALSLGNFEYGRLLALLIVSNIALIFLSLYTKSKVDNLKLLLDRSLRALAADATEPTPEGPLPSIMVIVPALNEAENLQQLLPRMPSSIVGIPVGVLVVDDGSSDETKKCALAHGCFVSRSPINRGQGAASRIGYAFLAKHQVRYGVTMDADNQHRPEDLERLLAPVLANKYDLVIGSRVLGSAEKDSLTRSLGVSAFSWILTCVSGVRLTDCSSGFKAFDMRKMAALDLREDQFQSSEVLIAAARAGMRVGEVPIHIRRRSMGESKKGTNLTYGFRFFRTMARSWWR